MAFTPHQARLRRQRIVAEAWRRRRGETERPAPGFKGMLSRYSDDDILAVNQALPELELVDPQAASLVELRFFCGLSLEKAARALECTVEQAEKEWAVAKAWLRRALNKADPVSTGPVDESGELPSES